MVKVTNMRFDNDNNKNKMTRYLSPLAIWALSFGCAVGWGSFVMPGTTFLPLAGPLGTVIGVILGAVLMLVIGLNYSFLIKRYPDSGGTLTYAVKTFGYDHGFISSWFLILVYIAIVWANATALPLMARFVVGDIFKFGFCYSILGYDVYMGEVLLSMLMILLFGLICESNKRLAAAIQTVAALLLLSGILFCFFMVVSHSNIASLSEVMTFSGSGKSVSVQVWGIVMLAPWAFVGFESVSNSAGEMTFDHGHMGKILEISVITSAVAYILLSLAPAFCYPSGFSSLQAYLGEIGDLKGIYGLPVFYAVHAAMGEAGIVVLGIAAFSAILTGLIGNYVVSSRLIFSMADDGILPSWFGYLDEDGNPRHAYFFIIALSVFIPLLGRSALGWIIDVNTLGASIAYLYTSAAALVIAKNENRKKEGFLGVIGIIISIAIIVYFLFFSSGAIQTETYFILACWAILGFAFFYYVFNHDGMQRFGKSAVAWVGLMLFVFLISFAWIKQSDADVTRKTVNIVETYYEDEIEGEKTEAFYQAESFAETHIMKVGRIHTRNSFIQFCMNLISLVFLFSIYNTMNKREKKLELQKMRAEESSRAKTRFLFNMSHDIRTPLNTILGFTRVMMNDEKTRDEDRQYAEKIDIAGKQLLGIIDDVLEMSSAEDGKIVLRNEENDIARAVTDTFELFYDEMMEKEIKYSLSVRIIPETLAVFDRTHFMRILMNLISNACKFTDRGGEVSVTLTQSPVDGNGNSEYCVCVKDNGIGIDKKFVKDIFEPFARARTSTESGINGTGLGLAITKSIVDAMDGTIEVVTEIGKGSEFIVKLTYPVIEKQVDTVVTEEKDSSGEDLSGKRILLAEDMDINREIAVMLLEDMGFVVESVVDGKEAFDKYKSAQPGYYDLIITDIQMPVMDGYELTKAVRGMEDNAYSGIPIVAMTANAMKEDQDKSKELGMNGHIPKPLDVDVMSEIIREALRR